MEITDKQVTNLTELAKKAGDVLLSYWPKTSSNPDYRVQTKSDGSFVTTADFKSNEVLTAGLKAICPRDGIISEETAIDPAVRRLESFWIIDPLDGTKSFVEGADDFSILLGHCRNGTVDFGLMYFPARNCLAVGQKGRGAKINGQDTRVSSNTTVRNSGLFVRHFDPISLQAAVLPYWIDSGYGFLKVASGELDALVIKMVKHKEWDVAAPSVLIEESGGRITDEKGAPLSFTSSELSFNYVVASNGLVHEKLLAEIREVEKF